MESQTDFFAFEERLVEIIAQYKSMCEREGVDFDDSIKDLIDRAQE
jgi:hypothetical protein